MGRSVMARRFLEYFQKKGYVLSLSELKISRDAPAKAHHIRRAWGTYKRFLNAIKARYPNEWEELVNPAEPEPEVKEPAPKQPAKPVQPKTAPKATPNAK